MSRRFANLDPEHGLLPPRMIFRWAIWDRLTGRRRIAPPGPPAPEVAPDLERIGSPRGARLTWLGHASFLGRIDDAAFLIDPVFSRRIGGVYRRHGAPPLAPEQLPPLRAILITHNHYDHLDAASLRALPRSVPCFVPMGLGALLRRWGFESVTELEWWQEARAGDLRITFVPARHWSRRSLFDTNRTLWGGFVVRRGEVGVYHAGDSGWFDTFFEIGCRFPGLAAAILPVGAYAPAWFMEKNHMNPEQACRAFFALDARVLIPMHWGTFQLTDEPIAEPAQRLRAYWAERHTEGEGTDEDGRRRLAILALGETLDLAPEG